MTESERRQIIELIKKEVIPAIGWVKFDNKYMRHDIGKAIDEA